MQFLNRLICMGVFFCLVFCPAFSMAKEKNSAKIEQLQNNVSILNNQLQGQEAEAGALKETVKEQQAQIDSLKQNLAFVYKQTITDTGIIERYKLGNQVYLRSSYYDLVREDNSTGEKDYETSFVNYLDLKFSAVPMDELQFHGTLTMYKLWGTWNAPESIKSPDFNYSSKPSDTGVKVKRAYADYRPEWLGRHANLTFGRLPTSDGYLTKYRYNRPSQTSYTDLTFNAESDGAALTFYIDNPVVKSLSLVYARSEDETDQNPFKGDPHGLSDIDFYTAELNSKLPFLDNTGVTVQWLRIDNIRSTGDDILRDLIDFGQLPFSDLNFPHDLGYLDKYTLQVENERLFNFPVDIFASVACSKSKPNHKQVYAKVGDNWVALHPSDLAALPEALQQLYLISDDNQDSHTGWAVYAGFRYNIDYEPLLNPKIGFEYFSGSRYWVGLNIAALDPYQKLNTRGSVWEIYWVQPLVENRLQFRTGYQKIDREYTESLMAGLYGAPTEIDEDDGLFSLSMEFMF